MLHHTIAFQNGWYLLLLGLLPLVWCLSYRSLAGLGRGRRATAIAVRSMVMGTVILALAETQVLRQNDRLTVIYLLDQSLSIPEPQRAAMLQYVNASIGEHRRDEKEDRAGVIVFARGAEVEVPPVEFSVPLAGRVESMLDRQHTNLAGAMQRALAMFPPDAAKRIVIVSDGNENRGDALGQARAIADAGVSIDVVPVTLPPRIDVGVEKIALPASVRRGQPFEIRIVLTNAVADDASANRPISGRVRVVRKAGQREETIAEAPVELGPGKTVFPLREEIDQPDFYTYQARFIPDDPAADAVAQNNVATNFTHASGKGHVLLIEDWENPGRFDLLVDRLRSEGLEVTLQASNQLFTSLAELQRYDTVILADVPRTSGFDANNVSTFSDEQMHMLARNTEELGCGLIMLGGPNSFGAGGWTNTVIEEAMPVDFQIKSAKAVPVGALALVIDRSGSMQGQKIALARAAAIAAIRVLGQRDFATVVAFDSAPYHVVPIQRVGDGRPIAARIDRLSAGGGTDLYPAMQRAFQALDSADAGVKHMIVLTDGNTPDRQFAELTDTMRKRDITVSAVAIGADAARPLLTDIATRGGGKFYAVRSPRAVPRIFMREARRVARPLVFEPSSPVRPQIVTNHEIVHGLDGPLPSVRGFVLTSLKQSPLVEAVAVSPQPVPASNATILATWTYGLGKTAAFTTDAGARWADQWTIWENYDRFFSQLIRWSMRPTADTGNFTVATETDGDRTRVVVTALDKDNMLLNYQAMTGSVVGPDMQSIPLSISQTAPGRYQGEFESSQSGSYMIMVTPGAGQAGAGQAGAGQVMIRTGVNVGYPDEFRRRQTNDALLTSLAELRARAGEPGKLAAPLPASELLAGDRTFRHQLSIDPFRRDLQPAAARRDIWPLLVMLCGCAFLADVFVRRVHLSFDWLVPACSALAQFAMGYHHQPVKQATMTRLRSRKAEVQRHLNTKRATARFDTDQFDEFSHSEAIPTVVTRDESNASARQQSATRQESIAEDDQPAEQTYTLRLLKVKQQVWQDRRRRD